MPKYAYFDHTEPAPQRVRGWYNTDRREIPNLPNKADLWELTEAQWAKRMTPDPSGWSIDKGNLIRTPPPPKPAAPTTITVPKAPVG